MEPPGSASADQEPVASQPVTGNAIQPLVADAQEINSADALIETLARNFGPYNEARLLKVLENFNLQQLKKHDIDVANANETMLPKDFVKVEFQDDGDYFSLQISETTAAHTFGIDVGEEQFRSVHFSKKTMEVLSDMPVKSQAIAKTGLHIGIGELESCSGTTPGSGFSIFDLKQAGKIYHEENFQDQPYSYKVKPLRDGVVEISTLSERYLPASEKESKQCEIGDWVNITETTYTVACHVNGGNCTVQKKAKYRAACSENVGCD
ncbi:hypothetical protein [Undibacterium sp. TS12]|uniref:hypothetical protein n=1 Tax=Undibacterium sp. TS12 TaxID=2908202 RepID=UPI001F4C67D4|nr:hypothetical protein [Undibacterium sp. TS12]MCH8619883.1 hypothetical protein [Undibacterium sp. TS12]